MHALEYMIMIAGLGALGALWVFVVVVGLQAGWNVLLAPLMAKIRMRLGRGRDGSKE